jgi:hypothetical protein
MATKVVYDAATGETTEVEMTGSEQAAFDALQAVPSDIITYAGRLNVDATVRTTDATPVEIYRLPTEQKHVYQSTLTLIGIDAANGVTKSLEGRFVHKRLTANALQVGAITVLSDIHDAAAAAWAPNAQPSGTDVVFTVAGAAGRTIDWIMSGQIVFFAPSELPS